MMTSRLRAGGQVRGELFIQPQGAQVAIRQVLSRRRDAVGNQDRGIGSKPGDQKLARRFGQSVAGHIDRQRGAG